MPMGSSERLEGVRVAIWSTKCLTAPLVRPVARRSAESDLQPVGHRSALEGTVTNRLSVPMEDAILAFGKQVYLLGNDRRRARRSGSSWPRTGSSRVSSRNATADARRPAADQPRAGIDRPDLMLALMFHDSQAGVASERRWRTTRSTTST